ncbi:MAG: DUF1587 domain-containing protein [Planctomycetaceae bacterium]|nr:DUF1587 domain-containing protein [Planctomycetaceae bacterium]
MNPAHRLSPPLARPFIQFAVTTAVLCACAQAAPPAARFPQQHRAFLSAHGFDCHSAELQEGNVDLVALPFHITTLQQAELWQKVLNAVNSGEMPPKDANPPGSNEKTDFLDDLAQTMVAARRALSDSGGRISMRRLNRREYCNTIAHLTGVKVDVSALPADGGAGTFDTVGASQFLSSDQFQQYLKLGRQAIDEMFEKEWARQAGPRVFRVEPETTVDPRSLRSLQQLEATQERFFAGKPRWTKPQPLQRTGTSWPQFLTRIRGWICRRGRPHRPSCSTVTPTN